MRHPAIVGTQRACRLALWGVAALMANPALMGCSAPTQTQEAQNNAGGVQVVGLALSQSDVSRVTATIAGSGTPQVFPMTKKGN
ncbi:MAG TPA: hypothetical protein VF518_10385, partial [Polyangia bacterium]